jgi:hypothetical protein
MRVPAIMKKVRTAVSAAGETETERIERLYNETRRLAIEAGFEELVVYSRQESVVVPTDEGDPDRFAGSFDVCDVTKIYSTFLFKGIGNDERIFLKAGSPHCLYSGPEEFPWVPDEKVYLCGDADEMEAVEKTAGILGGGSYTPVRLEDMHGYLKQRIEY